MMNTPDKQYSDGRIELKGILSEFREALEEEIDKIKKSGQSSTLLYAGRQIESVGAEFWYRFNVEYVPVLPADTPCKLLIGKDQFDATVISFEENAIVISTKVRLPDSIGKARLENGATVLMERLIKCIEENSHHENRIGRRMLPSDGGAYSAQRIYAYNDLVLNEGNTQSQNKAIESALSNDITYIWGPPGTGKTTVIGQIIDELFKRDRSVLVVSHTNMAVDGAIEKADKAYSGTYHNDDESYPILRIGVPARRLPDRVLLSHHVSVLGKELYEQKALLEKQQAELIQRNNEILPMLAKDVWVKENKLENIEEILQIIAKYETKLNEIQNEIENVGIEIQREEAIHPEYIQYSTLSKIIKAKRTNYDAICGEVCKIEAAISELPFQIQCVQDEIKKYDIYAELRTQEAKYMSASFLQNELGKINTQISFLNEEITILKEKQALAQQTVSDYEKKNSVAKLLVGKNAVTKAKDTLRDISIRLPQAKKEVQRQNNLAQKYSHQLENLLLLQEQIKAVVPTKTRDYWKEELKRLKSEFHAAKNALPDLRTKKTSIHKELCDLELQRSQAKATLSTIRDYRQTLQQLQEHLEKVKVSCNRADERCSELLKREYTLCERFFDAPTDRNNSFCSLDDYIYYYNNDRISLKLKGMSPVQYRTHSQAS